MSAALPLWLNIFLFLSSNLLCFLCFFLFKNLQSFEMRLS
jgi:hypothetical protein